jgi:hypothetical protein
MSWRRYAAELFTDTIDGGFSRWVLKTRPLPGRPGGGRLLLFKSWPCTSVES